jgi:hypothetical protein
MAIKQIIDQIRMGDRVTFTNRMGKSQTGKAVMYGPGGWVLNMGGAHGTPAVVKEWEITKVVRPKGSKSTLGTARLSGVRNPACKVGDFIRFTGADGRQKSGTVTAKERGNLVVLSSNRVPELVHPAQVIGKVQNPVGRSKNIAGFRDAMGIFHPIRSGVRQSYSATKQRSVQRMDKSPYVDGTKPKKRKPAKKTAAKKRK